MVVHASAGALVGEMSQTAFTAFSVSFLLHFLMDMVPHGDHEIVANYKKNKQIRKIIAFLLMDITATLIFIMALCLTTLPFNAKLVFWGVFGGLLPDMLVAIYQTFEIKLLKKFNYFWVIIKKDINTIFLTIINFLPQIFLIPVKILMRADLACITAGR